MKKVFLALLLLSAPVLADVRVTRLADNGVTTRTVSSVQADASEPAADQTQTMSDTWTWGGGIHHTVTTVRRDNEDATTWTKRHKDAVTVALAYFPPDHN